MEDLKTRFKSDKVNALFKDITPLEYLLCCIPFLLSLVSIPTTITALFDDAPEIFAFIYLLTALGVPLVFGLAFLLGLRWRIIYFAILLLFGNFLLIFLGRPWEYFMTADRDSAIRIGIEAILQGKFPYYSRTCLGNCPTPLPFTFIFYLPIYLITGGYTFYMNLIIFTAFSIVLLYNFIDSKRDYLIIPVIAFIVFSDWFFLEVFVNSDLVNTGLILGMIIFLLPDEIPEQKVIIKYLKITPLKPQKIDKRVILFAIFFGSLLAMRILNWLVGIIIVLYVLKNYGLKNTFYLVLITIGVFLVFILPFMFQDLNYFLYVCPLGTNASPLSNWRPYNSIPSFGHFILDLLNIFLNYGDLNGIIIMFLILGFSCMIGLIKCENKFHLFLIITMIYLIFLIFFLFGFRYAIISDYIPIMVIPFVLSFLYSDLENSKKNSNTKVIQRSFTAS